MDVDDEMEASSDEYEYEYVDSDEEKKLDEDKRYLASEGRKRSGAPLSLDGRTSRKGNLKTTGLDGFLCGDLSTNPNTNINNNTNFRHYPSGELGLGSLCTRCRLERHAPVQDCHVFPSWIKKRQQIPTVDIQHVRLCLKRFIRECAKRYDVDMLKAGVMCRRGNWDMGQIMASEQLRTRADPRAMTTARLAERHIDTVLLPNGFELLEPRVPSVVAAANFTQENNMPETTCPICFEEDVPIDQLMSMECGHGFCRPCWREFIDTLLGERNILNVAFSPSCPHVGCAEPITEIQMESIAPDLMPTFEDLQLNAFVYSNRRTLRWCPGPDCSYIAVKPRNDVFEDCSLGFQCGQCDTNFCFTCGNPPHQFRCVARDLPPGTQRTAAPMFADLVEDTKGAKQIKLCPKCNIPIEKNGGCNHMTCKCGNHFCWLCRASDTTYSHFCGAEGATNRLQTPRVQIDINLDYVAAALKEGGASDETRAVFDQMQVGLGRYAHYYNRYYAHMQGQRFAERQCPCLENRAYNYTQMAGISSGTDIDFIRSANETLVASRRLLKYSYCSAYYYHDEETARLGFYHLEQLERFTEELSGLSENALSRQDRSRVVTLISVVTKAMSAVADFECNPSEAST